MSAPGLPPTTIGAAMDLYYKLRQVGGHLIDMTEDRKELCEQLAAALVALGDNAMEMNDTILNQKDALDALTEALQAYVNEHLEDQMAKTPDDELARQAQEEIGEITGVHWQGSTGDFFAHMGEINHALAQDISLMARQQAKREESMRKHPSAIDATATEIDPSEGPDSL